MLPLEAIPQKDQI